MERFVTGDKIIKDGGNSKMVYIMQEARQLGLDTGDDMFVVCARKENRDFVMSRLCSQGTDLFFIAVLRDDDKFVYDIRSCVSELELSRQFGDELVTILGPFADLHDCLEFRFRLEDEDIEDENGFKSFFKEFVRGLR